eukprot:974028-Rhodomonas_salina.1
MSGTDPASGVLRSASCTVTSSRPTSLYEPTRGLGHVRVMQCGTEIASACSSSGTELAYHAQWYAKCGTEIGTEIGTALAYPYRTSCTELAYPYSGSGTERAYQVAETLKASPVVKLIDL